MASSFLFHTAATGALVSCGKNVVDATEQDRGACTALQLFFVSRPTYNRTQIRDGAGGISVRCSSAAPGVRCRLRACWLLRNQIFAEGESGHWLVPLVHAPIRNRATAASLPMP